MLRLAPSTHLELVAHSYAGLPDEACGLLLGEPATGAVHEFRACENVAASSKVYEIGGRDWLRADRRAEELGLEVVGVVHSHTHTECYPSPTDVAQAPDPSWHYVIVSLKRAEPSVRSYLIVDGEVTEEPIVLAEAAPSG